MLVCYDRLMGFVAHLWTKTKGTKLDRRHNFTTLIFEIQTHVRNKIFWNISDLLILICINNGSKPVLKEPTSSDVHF